MKELVEIELLTREQVYNCHETSCVMRCYQEKKAIQPGQKKELVERRKIK